MNSAYAALSAATPDIPNMPKLCAYDVFAALRERNAGHQYSVYLRLPLERRGARAYAECAFSTKSEHRSPIMMQAPFVLPDTSVGIMEPSATRNPSTP